MIARLSALMLAGLLAGGPAMAQTIQPTLENLYAYAEQDHPTAMVMLGRKLAEGDGVLPDYAEAARLFRKAAEIGVAEAQNRYGQQLFAGLGVEQDIDAALSWLRKAADQGDPQHLHDLGSALESANRSPEDLAAAAEAYGAASDMGLLSASTSLGNLYMAGTGVEQDYAEAKRLFEVAADKGDARALNNLGLLYVRGHGVDQDYDRAFELFGQAAESGLSTAMVNLAGMYENGFGVEQSDALHGAWLARAQAGQSAGEVPGSLSADPAIAPLDPASDAMSDALAAAAGGDPVAQFRVAWAYLGGDAPTHADAERALHWFDQAARRGHGASMANLGQLYARGIAVPQDYLRAYAWTSAAVAAGQKDHRATLDWLLARMPDTQVTAAQDYAATLWQPAPAFRDASR